MDTPTGRTTKQQNAHGTQHMFQYQAPHESILVVVKNSNLHTEYVATI